MNLAKRQERPAFATDYVAATRKAPTRKSEFGKTRFVAIDAETSGFRLGTDRVLSIAAIDIANGQIEVGSVCEWIVCQPRTAPNKASEIHGLLPSEIRQGQPEAEVLRALLPRLSGAVVVGHNIWFDALMLDEAMQRHLGIRFLNPMIDCGKMAMNELIPFHRVGYARQRTPTIEDICGHLNLPMPDRHTAEGDAFIAAELFLLLAGRMRRRIGRPLRLGNLPVKKRLKT